MADPFVPVGYDYAQAALDLRRMMSYDQIAAYCGYENKSQVSKIIAGRIPNHPEGEALYALYVQVFHFKPPMTPAQEAGEEVPIWERLIPTTSA